MPGELSKPPSDGPTAAPADASLDARAKRLMRGRGMRAARALLERDDGRTLSEQRELTEIAAPPFGEGERAARMAELMVRSGLTDVAVDAEGNVVAAHAASAPDAAHTLVVAAHLDTVFPGGTPVTVRERDGRLCGPGISDDGRGLAAILALSRALSAGGWSLGHRLLVVATVGEEGAGDLRGVRHLFSTEGAAGSGCRGFVSLDGAGLRRIVNAGLGSLRYRARVRGPGGHSWVDWGTPNPIHALGRAVTALTSIPLPTKPAATLSVARWTGGTSINAIPREAWIDFEIRSEDQDVLAELDRQAREALGEVVAAEDPVGARGRALELSVEVTGNRPAGYTPQETHLVRSAAAATRALGAAPELAVSSTDANIPMALGIPAVTMGAGGEAGLTHTPGEWYRNVRGPDGIVRALLTLLLADGRPG